MKYEITLLMTDNVMHIFALDRWPTREDAEEMLLHLTPHTRAKPYFVHEWSTEWGAHTQSKLPVMQWGGKPARVWSAHPSALAPLCRENKLADEIKGERQLSVRKNGKILGPVLIAVKQ